MFDFSFLFVLLLVFRRPTVRGGRAGRIESQPRLTNGVLPAAAFHLSGVGASFQRPAGGAGGPIGAVT